MPRRKSSAAQLSMAEFSLHTAPCVPAIQAAVDNWRDDDYPGVTETTRVLLNHWFRTDHRLPNRRPFAYHDSQRCAIETLIYLYEVADVRRHKDLIEHYAVGGPNLRLLQYDEFARYCFKMATGSGKTKVMTLAFAWQFFNAVAEARPDYARTCLVIAPNVIVFERLRLDFANGRIFKVDPVIPPGLRVYWDAEFYMRGEGERAHSNGAVYLTNIQQFYERPANDDDEPDVMTAMLGPKPKPAELEIEDFQDRILARGGPVLVINDEAHHTHDEESEWNRCIRRLHGDLKAPGDQDSGLAAQLDFTATPRYSKGALFTWTVVDYPLRQAIEDGIVKRPMKGIAKNIGEAPSDIASTRYRAYLTAGVERWREYRDQLKPLGKKPVLFVMMNSTADANDVGDYLRTAYPSEFAGDGLLVIHTNRSGDVSTRDLEVARKTAREIDEPTSPINAIVSVLMLREGWDVQNVTVVVGLRPFTAKANILPEQTIGRGLRLMFRDLASDYVERVDVIGNKAFIAFVEQLERDEEMALGTFAVGEDKLTIITIMPDPDKMDKDITIPSLSPILSRRTSLAEEITALDVMAFSCPTLPKKETDEAAQSFRYEGYDLLSLQKLIEREYTLPQPQTPQEIISYYAKRIAQEVKLPAHFALLAPKVREFLERRAFGENVSLDDPVIFKAIGSNVAQYVTIKTFAQALLPLVVEDQVPVLQGPGRRLSETPPFPYSRTIVDATKTMFNKVACDNDFEATFAKFLESASDVVAFAKLPEQFGFSIEYTDTRNNLRYYEPDFVAVAGDGTFYLLETKGREDVDVARKDRAAEYWCESATRLTREVWQFIKVPQDGFMALKPDEVADLMVFTHSTLG